MFALNLRTNIVIPTPAFYVAMIMGFKNCCVIVKIIIIFILSEVFNVKLIFLLLFTDLLKVPIDGRASIVCIWIL